ncbi:hypothetical protein ACFX13_029784 [Malus domestica]
MAVYRYRTFFPSSLKALRDVIKTKNDFIPLEREVRSLENNNQNVDYEKLEDFHAKEAAFLRDLEELQSHRRVVVEDLQDAEALCDLASSEKHGWKVEILINDDNSGNFKREVHDAGQRVGIEVTPEKNKVLKQH